MTTPGAATGAVLRWSSEEGWGVLLADATPGFTNEILAMSP